MPNNVVIDFRADVDGLKPAFDALLKLGKITDDDVKAFNAANAAQKELAATATKSASSYDKLAVSVTNVKKNIVDGSINKAIEGTAKLIDKNISATKTYDNSIRGLKQQYKDLLSLAIQNGENSPIGQQALKDAGELKDRIGDLQQATKNYSSDTATFDAIGQGISTIGAGFQAAQGAQALFGEGGEELQKTMVRLQATMALVNGLQQIQNALQAESALRLKLASISQATYTAVVGTSTGAMKAFRIALAATGIGALVLGLIALITNFDSVSESVKGFLNKFESLKPVVEAVTRGFERFKEILGFDDKLTKELDKLEAFYNSVNSSTEKLQKRGLALRKSNGENTLALEKTTNEILLRNQQVANDLAIKQFIAKSVQIGKIDEEEKQKLIDKVNDINDRIVELTARNNDIEFELLQRGLQARKNQIDARLQFAQKGSEAELKLKLNQIAAELAIENSQRDKVAGQVALNEAKANIARKKAFEDFKQFQLQGELDTANKKLTIVQAGSLEELNIMRNALDIENQMVLNNSSLTQTQKELKLAENAQKELDLIKKYGQAQISLAEQIELKKQTVGNDRLQKFEEEQKAEYDYYNKIADLEFQSSDQSYNRIEALRREKFTRAIQLLDAELSKVQQTNDNIIASEEKLQRDLEAKAKEDPANRKQYELAILESQERVKTSEEKAAEESIRINREKNIAIIADDNQAAENKKANLLKQVDLLQSISDQSAGILKDANAMELQGKIQALDDESRANQKQLDDKLISQRQYEINEKEIEKRKNEAKKKAFEQNKNIQLAEIAINTAVAVVKAYANTGLPAALPFIALTVAAGALQAAAISKQKYPGFAKGTNFAPKGWAWVGEQGPELVNLSGGEKIKTAKESKVFAQKQYQMEVFNSNTMASTVDNSPVLSPKGKQATELFQNEPGFALDYNLLSGMISQGVGQHISKMPLTHFTMDKNGFKVAVKNGNNITNYLDNRYSTN